MDFIVVSDPAQRASAKTSRRVHSHAARVAHARSRRRQMAEYHQVKVNLQKCDANELIGNNSTPNDISPESQDSSTPIPCTLTGDLQPEGISRFRQNLSPLEHFIFDHCKLVLNQYLILEVTKARRRHPNCPARANLLLSHSHGFERESHRCTKPLDVIHI